jgi:membrane protease YdiL (CAAX protease family)
VEPAEPLPIPEAPLNAAGGSGATRLLALIEVLLCSGFPTQLVITAALTQSGFVAFHDSGELSMPFVSLLALIDSLVITALVLLLLYARGERPSLVLLGTRPRWRESLLGLLLIPIVFCLALGLLLTIRTFFPFLQTYERNPLESLISTPSQALLFGAVAIIAGGVREEVQRGFILHRFDQYLGGGWLGLVIFSVAFGIGHVLQGWDAAITTAALGAFWGAIYLRRRSILAPLISHAGFNSAEILRYTLFGP